ncbi:MAG: hypothetical protein QM527_01530 [Alphaproteobacteria bacterium]|nr:hypothetical protein [Alphaproteobacteria bacterium]
MKSWRALAWGATWLAAGLGQQALAQDSDELLKIRSSMEQIEDVHAQQLRACHQKLNVTSCRQAVLASRVEALRPLIERERDLQTLARKQKADARRSQIESRRTLQGVGTEEDSSEPPASSGVMPSRQP